METRSSTAIARLWKNETLGTTRMDKNINKIFKHSWHHLFSRFETTFFLVISLQYPATPKYLNYKHQYNNNNLQLQLYLCISSDSPLLFCAISRPGHFYFFSVFSFTLFLFIHITNSLNITIPFFIFSHTRILECSILFELNLAFLLFFFVCFCAVRWHLLCFLCAKMKVTTFSFVISSFGAHEDGSISQTPSWSVLFFKHFFWIWISFVWMAFHYLHFPLKNKKRLQLMLKRRMDAGFVG